MRLLFVHADCFAFEATTEARTGDLGDEKPSTTGQLDECVAAFVTVERGDGVDLDAAVANTAGAVRKVADHLGTPAVALAPSDHLSDDPAAAEVAATALRKLDAALDADFEVLRAPVGWHVAVELSSKGHPFAEQSVRVGPDRDPGRDAESGEPERGGADGDRATPEWKIAFPDGEVADARDAAVRDRLDERLRAFVDAELGGGTASRRAATASVAARLREWGLADEVDRDGADSLRWFPRGKLVRDLLVRRVADLAIGDGAMPVETPGASGPRVAGPGSGRDDPFSLAVDGTASGRDRPPRLYEVVTYSSSGDRASVTTPEIRTATRDAAQAREELRAGVDLCRRVAGDLGLDPVPAIRATEEFYEDNREWVASLVADLGEPALLELRPGGRREGPIRIDLAVVDDAGRALANPRVELARDPAGGIAGEFDFGDDAEGVGSGSANEAACILRCAPVGSVERALAALLEPPTDRDAPHLPTWLAPTQVRFVPVGADHVDYCEALAADLDAAGVRADVDDREETVGERLARAEADLVPYYAVVGDREVDGKRDDGALQVTVRAEAAERELDLVELRAAVLDVVGDLPAKRRYLPRRVSRHPDFAGQ